MALRPAYRLTQHQGHRLVTGPAAEPVTLAEVRTLLRDPPAADDDFIEDCITQARMMFEAATGIACINQTWKLTLNDWPGNVPEPTVSGYVEMPTTELYSGTATRDYVELPRYPLSSVSGINVYDENDSATAVTVNTVFFSDTQSFPGRLVLRFGQTWPVNTRRANGVEITYVAGFGADATTVPETIKLAIQRMAGYLYENRGDGCSATAVFSGTGALQIAAEYVNVRL